MSASEVRKARRPLAGATSIKTKSGFVRAGVYFCSGITFAVLIYMLVYIFVKGVPYLSSSLFSWKYNSENCSVVPALVNTLIMTLLALLIACPLGIGSAIYLVEYFVQLELQNTIFQMYSMPRHLLQVCLQD